MNASAGQSIKLTHGEYIGADGEFSDQNLQTVGRKSGELHQVVEYTCKDGLNEYTPTLCIFGFQYVLVETDLPIDGSEFTAHAVYFDMDETASFTCDHALVNQPFRNAVWSEKSNFVDIPTDCPQRERSGWTGDAGLYCHTGIRLMDAYPVYARWLAECRVDQYPDGKVCNISPRRTAKPSFFDTLYDGSCAWGDAATVIPWNLYRYYGDATLLAEQYENMKLWVDYIRREDEQKCGGSHIWRSGFHFADWLALDNPDPNSPLGGTDTALVATGYYYLSASLTAKAARALGRAEDAEVYGALAGEIREAFRREYFNADGTLKIKTQTAHVLSLNLELAPPEHARAVADALRALIRAKGDHLDTGFVGTYQLCPTLTRYGMTDVAYTLLFNRDFPSWLYEVDRGATTIWERWNSVLPDGSVSDTGMNSMNHYAYGSIVQWIYQTVAGLRPDDAAPGFKRAIIEPRPDARLEYAECRYDSASGRYCVRWQRGNGGTVYTVSVPFDATATFRLPEGQIATAVNGGPAGVGELTLPHGTWIIEARDV